MSDLKGELPLQGRANGVLYSGSAYAFTNSLSGLRLANPFSNAAGDPVQQHAQSNSSGHWFLQSDGNGHAKIVSATNGFVLGVNNSSSSGAPLILETNGAGEGQLWTLKPVGTSTIELVNLLSGLSATVQTTAPMETVKQTTGTSTAGQLWTPTLNTSIPQNHAPVFTANPLSAKNATEDAAYAATIAGSATDVDAGATLTYAKVSGPAWLSVASNGALSGTPTNTNVGTNAFTVSVTDSIAAPVTATLNITVINTNDAPTINSILADSANLTLPATTTVHATASDVDGDALNYNWSLASGPAAVTFATGSAADSTVTFTQLGNYTLEPVPELTFF